MPDQDQQAPRHHLLIAGTGRAGTSFLVRWLAAAGLRTHLASHDTPMWDDDANAGLEDLPVSSDRQAPYVMKSPWLVEVIDDVLNNPGIALDGVIIPVRDLTEAATSRVVRELQSALRGNPWMNTLGRSFEQWGTTPGGVVYSLDPVDQARLLAVSFHRLVQRLVKADIPIVLLDFPRLALDADYLFYKLRRFVPATIAQAREAHAALADPDKIRVGQELAATQEPAAAQGDGAPAPRCEAPDRLEVAALRREVRRLTGELADAGRAAAAQLAAEADLRGALDAQAVELTGLAPIVPASDADRQAMQAHVATLVAAVEQRRAQAEQATRQQQEAIAGLRRALDAQATELAGLAARLAVRDATLESAQARVATLTAEAEHWRSEAELAATARQAEATALRSALDARAAELARLEAALEARDADLQAAQARVATLTDAGEQRRAEAGRAMADQQAVIAGLQSGLDARGVELGELAATLTARDAGLAAAQAQVAGLVEAAERQRAESGQALAERGRVAAGLQNDLDARGAELGELAATLAARDAGLAAAQARVADLIDAAKRQFAASDQALAERDRVVAGLQSGLDARAAELAEVAETLAARDAGLAAAQAHVAGLTEAAERQLAASEQALAERDRVVAGLQSGLDARAAELAEVAETLAARDAGLAAAQAQVADLIDAAERQLAASDQALAERDSVVAGLQSGLDARAAELAEVAATLTARDAGLAAAQARIAELTDVAERQLVASEQAVADRDRVIAGLRTSLDAQGTELTLRTATLQARDAALETERARVASVTAAAAQQRSDAERGMAEQQTAAGSLRAALDARTAELAGVTAALAARDADSGSARRGSGGCARRGRRASGHCGAIARGAGGHRGQLDLAGGTEAALGWPHDGDGCPVGRAAAALKRRWAGGPGRNHRHVGDRGTTAAPVSRRSVNGAGPWRMSAG